MPLSPAQGPVDRSATAATAAPQKYGLQNPNTMVGKIEAISNIFLKVVAFFFYALFNVVFVFLPLIIDHNINHTRSIPPSNIDIDTDTDTAAPAAAPPTSTSTPAPASAPAPAPANDPRLAHLNNAKELAWNAMIKASDALGFYPTPGQTVAYNAAKVAYNAAQADVDFQAAVLAANARAAPNAGT